MSARILILCGCWLLANVSVQASAVTPLSYQATAGDDAGAKLPAVEPASPNVSETVDLNALPFGPRSDNPPAVDAGRRAAMVLLAYCVLIVGASLAGGWLPSIIELTHTRMQTIISFVGGLMLGIGVFHLLPHAVDELRDATLASRWVMVGIVMMFVLLRLFHFHNHEPVTPVGKSVAACDHDHDDNHDHDHEDSVQSIRESTGEEHSTADCHAHGHSHGLSWLGIAFGLSVHTLIDGIALGASVYAEANQAAVMSLFGLGTFLAVVLHKPLDAVSITSLMVAGGWKKSSMNMVNGGFALMCPLGAVLFLVGASQFQGFQQEILGTALAFSAGVFICIALSDLLPEMEFHSHNRVQLTVALGLGIILAWGITFLEPGHLHG